MQYFDKFEPESYYHIINHAVGNENLFKSPENFLYFLRKYDHYLSPVCKTFCYCLMPNHFHFMVQIRDEETIIELAKIKKIKLLDFHKFIMQQLSNFLNCYAKSFNKQQSRRGALFIDYTRRKEITGDSYFTQLVNYIHQNPIAHNFCKRPADWKYSSYRAIVELSKDSMLEITTILEWFGGLEEFVNFHNENGSIN